MKIAIISPMYSPLVKPFTGGGQSFLSILLPELAAFVDSITLFVRPDSSLVLPAGIEMREVDLPKDWLRDDPKYFPEVTAPGRRSLEEVTVCDASVAQAITEVMSDETFHVLHDHTDTTVGAYMLSAVEQQRADLRPSLLRTLHIAPRNRRYVAAAAHSSMSVCTTAVSEPQARAWQRFGTNIGHVMTNGVETCGLGPPSPGRGYAVLASRITPSKGVAQGIDAAILARKTLVVFGPVHPSDFGYFEKEVLSRIKWSQGLVEYRGAVDRGVLLNWVEVADLFLAPSMYEEPFGLSAAEALVRGVPVVGTANGGLRALVKSGVNGFLVRDADPVKLAEGMRLVEELNRAIVAEDARHRLSVRRAALGYARIYRLLGGATS